MSYTPRYDRGDWKCVCESCGRIVKSSELKKRWDGYMVDERCWEPRQPQDFVRGVADYQAPPFTRPEQSDQFIPVSLSSWFINLVSSISRTTLDMVITIHHRVLNLITNTTSIVSLVTTYKPALVVNLITSTTSIVSMLASKITATVTTPKSVNGSSINKTTLG